MSELTKRVLTGSVLALTTLCVAFNSVEGLAILVAIAGTIIGYEFAKLSKMSPLLLGLVLGLILVVAFFTSPTQELAKKPPVILIFIVLLGMVFWLKNLFLVVHYPQSKPNNSIFNKVISLFLLIAPMIFLPLIQATDTSLLLLLFIIVWSADSFAYFSGKVFGKHKLALKLSSGKTVEGVIGGLAGVLLMTGIWMFVTSHLDWKYLLLAFITGIFSMIGDLYESVYKREAGVKDSGNILPGHGGLFDRLDGFLAAIPIFVIGVYLV